MHLRASIAPFPALLTATTGVAELKGLAISNVKVGTMESSVDREKFKVSAADIVNVVNGLPVEAIPTAR